MDREYFNDLENFKPNLDYSVSLNFKKEYIRHKRVICSLKEFQSFDIQNVWDVSYCKAFCLNGNGAKIGKYQLNDAARELSHP